MVAGDRISGVLHPVERVVHGVGMPVLRALLAGDLPGRVPHPVGSAVQSQIGADLRKRVPPQCVRDGARLVPASHRRTLSAPDRILVVRAHITHCILCSGILVAATVIQKALRRLRNAGLSTPPEDGQTSWLIIPILASPTP